MYMDIESNANKLQITEGLTLVTVMIINHIGIPDLHQ
jgi:hypothetical protein